MYQRIRIIAFILLLFLYVAPLGSCASKTTPTGQGSKTTWHALDELSGEELEQATIHSFAIYQSSLRGSETSGSGGAFYLVVLIASFLCSIVKTPMLWLRVLKAVLVSVFLIPYAAFSTLAIMAPTTTVYGWLFVLAGFTYVGSFVPWFKPKTQKHK